MNNLKEDIFNNVNIQEGDQVYVYIHRKVKHNKCSIQRLNRGFSPQELVFLLEEVKMNIIKQVRTPEEEPALISRKVLLDELPKEGENK